MTPDAISFWSMVGTWISGLSTTIAVFISLYLASSTRKPKLKIEIELSDYGNATLRVINISSIVATIRAVTLATSKKENYKQHHPNHYDLIKNPLLHKNINELNEYTILPDGNVKEFTINFSSLCFSYDKFLPYDEDKKLKKVIKMPPAYILVNLVGGYSFPVKLPTAFFKIYRDGSCSRLEEALQQAIDHPNLYLSYSSKNDLYKKQQERLEWYIKSKNNSLYLIL